MLVAERVDKPRDGAAASSHAEQEVRFLRPEPVLAAAPPSISYTGPRYAAQAGTCADDSLRTLPITPYDSLRVRAEFRRQAPTWPTLAADLSKWSLLWPQVKREADSVWVRTKPFVPGMPDTMASPVSGAGVNVSVWAIRRGEPGNASCVARKGVTP